MRILNKSGGERKRRRFSPLMWAASLLAMAVLALGVTGTLAQFVASITNNANNVVTAGAETFGFNESLVVNGVPQTPVCAEATAGQAVTCSDINKYGTDGAVAVPMLPGGTPNTTTVQLANSASTTPPGLPGTLALTVGACTVASDPAGANTSPGDLCGTVLVTLTCDSTPAVDTGPVSLTAFQALSPIAIETAIPAGGSVDCTFSTDLPASATGTNLQNLIASQDLTWTWTQA